MVDEELRGLGRRAKHGDEQARARLARAYFRTGQKDMVEVCAKVVKELRDKTGAAMGLCKQALVDTGGDMEKAEEWLRKKGVKAEVTARATSEGVLVNKLSPDGKTVVSVELKCETDFAAKNDRFRALAGEIADALIAKGAGVKDAAAALALPCGKGTIDEAIKAQISTVIKENIKFEWFERRTLEGPGRIGTYIHPPGKLSVLVGVLAPSADAAKKPELEALAKDVAMHVAAAVQIPVAVNREGVPKDQVEKERRFHKEQMDADPKDSKKPDQIKEKIIDGKMGRFFKERVLQEQPFVKDDSKSVEQVLAEVGESLGGAPKIAWFVRRQLGG
ncbi:translation elongation factor Ts [bacterium]|nr:translation elongation factor Ts [bacterium]